MHRFRHWRRVMGTLYMCVAPALLWSDVFVFEETFRFDDAPGWNFVTGNTEPGPRLTAGSVPSSADPEAALPQLDADGQGWLRMATRTDNQANSVWLDTPIPSAGNNIKVGFDVAFWDTSGGTGADGLVFFMYDAAVPFSAGGYGGSLGYANRSAIDGLGGGYMGLGLDVFGNFSNPTEGRNGGVGQRPGQIALRGPGSGQTGYQYLAGTNGQNFTEPGDPSVSTLFSNLAFPSYQFRPDQDAEDYRYVELELTSSNMLTVRMQAGFGEPMVDLFTADVSDFDRPDLLRIGFSGGTGGVNQVYEVRNLRVETSGSQNTWYWTAADGDSWTSTDNWSLGNVPQTYGDVVFSNGQATVTGPTDVLVEGGDKTLSNMFFSGQHGYTLSGPDGIVFDTNGIGDSYISVLNNPFGNADHEIGVNLQLNNDLKVQHLVRNQELLISGDVAIASNDLYLNSAGTLEVSGQISGSGDLIARGQGLKILSSANTYTGTTTVEAGILQARNNSALGGTGSGTTVQDGATLGLGGGVTISGEALTINGGGFQDLGALRAMDGSNTYAAGITLGSAASIGADSGSTLNITGTIQGGTSGHNLSFVPQAGGLIQVSGNIQDTWSSGTEVIHDGPGTTVISSNTTYTGATTIRQGILQANVDSALGVNWQPVVVESGGTLALGGSGFTYAYKLLTLEGPGAPGAAALWNVENNHTWSGAITLSGNTTIGSASGTLTLAQGIGTGGGHDLRVAGDGTVQLGNNINSVGNVFVDSGTLRNSGWGQIGENSRVTVASGATLDLSSGGDTIGSLAGGGNVVLGGGTFTIGNDNTHSAFSGTISGSSGVTQIGTGSTTFSGSNTFTGALSVNSGSVRLGADNVFANTMPLTLNGGTFVTNGFSDTMGQLNRAAASAIDFSGISGSVLSFSNASQANALSINNWVGSISGGGGSQLLVTSATSPSVANITFTGWGPAVVTGSANNWEIVPSLQGFYRWDDGGNDSRWNTNQNWVGNSAPPNRTVGTKIYFGDDAPNAAQTVEIPQPGGNDRIVGIMVIDATGNRNYSLRSGQNNNTRTLIFDNGGTAFLTVGGTGQHVLGSNAGAIVNIQLNNNTLITNNSTGAVGLTLGQSNHELNLNANAATFGGTGTTVINSQIIGTGSLVRNDSGTLRLNNNSNSFSGGTTVNSGVLQIGANGALGSGALTMNGGAVDLINATLNTTNNVTVGGDFAVTGGSGRAWTIGGNTNVTAGNRTMTIAGNTFVNQTGLLQGTGNLTVDGSGGLYLFNSGSTHSGNLTLNGGQLYGVSSTGTGNFTYGAVQSGQNYLGQGTRLTINGGDGGAVMAGTFTIASAAEINVNGGELYFYNYQGSGDPTTSHDFNFNGRLNVTDGQADLGSSRNLTFGAGSRLNLTGGETNLYFYGDASTTGTSGNAARIEVTGDALLNVAGLAAGGDFTVGTHDHLRVQGTDARAVVDLDSGDFVVNGRLQLWNQGVLETKSGTTTILSGGSLVDGGNANTTGTLQLGGDLVLAATAGTANAPNLRFDSDDDIEIRALAGTIGSTGWGTITQAGEGTTLIDASVNNIDAKKVDIRAGTLILGDDDQISNTTAIQLSGGTFATGGFSEVVHSLTLTADSTIDMGSASSILEFGAVVNSGIYVDGLLTVDNWSGSMQGGGTDQIIFHSQLSDAFLSNVYWSNLGVSGAIQLPSGEIVPIPEPGTVIMGVLLLGFGAYRERRRLGLWWQSICRHLFSQNQD